MNDRIKALVINKTIETSNVVTISFIPQIDDYKALPGQNLTIFFDETGDLRGRTYSLSNATNDHFFTITVEKRGLFSTKIHNLKIGDYFDISRPYGNFDMGEYPSVTAIAAGTGIAPIWGIINDLLDNIGSNVHLLYVSKTTEDIVFCDKIEKLGINNNNFIYDFFITDQAQYNFLNGKKRMIDLGNDILANERGSLFYLCGYHDFVKTMLDQLAEFGVPRTNISVECFK
jgi:ferredoxin-NADP reductase